jgi:hypothetical protein
MVKGFVFSGFNFYVFNMNIAMNNSSFEEYNVLPDAISEYTKEVYI